MKNKIWEQIAKDYELAKQCLLYSGAEIWERNDDKGFYHLWGAYYKAINTEEKQPLLYARILVMMAEFHHTNKYERFKKYIKPALDAYTEAISKGIYVTAEELKQVQDNFNRLDYELKKEEDEDEAIALIEGLKNIKDFQFHDSKLLYFEHTENDAILDIEWYKTKVRLKFLGILDIEINAYPNYNYINEFYCYRDYYAKDIIIFDIDSYKIKCSKIIATEKQ